MSDEENEIEAEESHGGRGHARLDEKELSEAEKVMAEKKAKQEEEEADRLRAYEEQRRIEREKEEEELRQLKEKQERRRQEREEEERQLAERRQQEEERRKQEEDERKKKLDAEKSKKEAEKLKRQQMQLSTGPLKIEKKDKGESSFDKFGNIVRAKAEMGLTKEQHDEQKRRFLNEICKPVDFDGVETSAIKAKVKEMYQRICRLEGDKYDLEQRHQRQEYDLKELNERQRQIARNKALKKGLDPNEAASSRHPPKVAVVSKYDRQIDRRSFRERRQLYEVTNAIPHFPNIPPPVSELEKVIKPYAKKEDEDENVEEEEE